MINIIIVSQPYYILVQFWAHTLTEIAQELDLSETERDIDTFTEFMQCLYDNGASITNDNVDTMLGLARKYQVLTDKRNKNIVQWFISLKS